MFVYFLHRFVVSCVFPSRLELAVRVGKNVCGKIEKYARECRMCGGEEKNVRKIRMSPPQLEGCWRRRSRTRSTCVDVLSVNRRKRVGWTMNYEAWNQTLRIYSNFSISLHMNDWLMQLSYVGMANLMCMNDEGPPVFSRIVSVCSIISPRVSKRWYSKQPPATLCPRPRNM